jgi:hypothetical protein
MAISAITRKHRYLKLLGILAAAVAISSCSLLFSAAPDFDPSDYPWPSDTPIKEPDEQGLKVLLEDTGNLAVLHGFSCAQSDRDGQEDFVRIQERLNLTDVLENGAGWVTDATVFLNGWDMEYIHKKHNVIGFSAAIARIKFERLELEWQAGGALAENKFDAGYRLCYAYTVLAWNANVVEMDVDHGDAENTFVIFENYNQAKTARHVLRNYRQDVGFIATSTSVGVLPRGFGMSWRQDRQLLQAAYEMGASENSVTAGANYGELDPPAIAADTMRLGDGAVSWDSGLILKDNATRHDFYAAEMVSVLAGPAVTLVHPPFAIAPREQIDQDCGGIFTGCITTGAGNPGVVTRDITVENLPFDYAVPVLSGWSLGYRQDDHTVRDLGVQIVDFAYDKVAGEPTGTLRYTVLLVADNREGDEPALSHRASVLGLTYPQTVAPPTDPPVDPPVGPTVPTPLPDVGPAIDE